MKYGLLWRNKWLTANDKDINGMIATFKETLELFENMADDGVYVDEDSGIEDDYTTLLTNNEEVAKKYGFEKEEDEGER